MRCILMDLRRAFAWRFWALSLGVTALFYLNMLNYPFYGTEDMIYRLMIGGDEFFLHAMLVLSTAVYGISFCQDWDNRNIRNVYIRTGGILYAFSKIFSCAISAVAALFVGKLIFVLTQLPAAPMFLNPVGFDGLDSPPNSMDMLAYNGHYVLWTFFNLLRFALEGAGFAVFALAVSTVLTNVFLVLIMPLIGYFVYDLLSDYLFFPWWLDLPTIYESVYCDRGVAITMLLPLFLSVLSCLIFGWLFYQGVQRRLEHG